MNSLVYLNIRLTNGVFVSLNSQFEVSDDKDSVQMLQRSSQVGEFYRMCPPAVHDEKKPLPASYMDVMLYDEEADKLVHITFEEALFASGIHNMTKEQINILLGGGAGSSTPNAIAALSAQVRAAHGKMDVRVPDVTAPTAITQDSEPNDIIDFLLDAVSKGIKVEICITLARPFIEHHMLSAVAAVSGKDTGATLYGPADMCVCSNQANDTALAYEFASLALA